MKPLLYSLRGKLALHHRRNLIIFSSMLLVVFMAALALRPLLKKTTPPSQLPPALAIDATPTEIGSAEVCRYWRPWQDALAPHKPSDLMATIVQRSRSLAARTERFRSWANGRPKSSEHVCAVGKNIDGIFTLDLVDINAACRPGDDPLDFSMAMHVERNESSRNINAFTFKLTTDTLSPARLRSLLAAQIGLVFQGYPHWHTAFPNFSDETRSGIGIRHTVKPERTDGEKLNTALPVREIATDVDWNPQRFWTRVPVLATWLLNLGALVTLDTTVKDGSGLILAHMVTSTGALGTKIRLPLAEQGLVPGLFSEKTSNKDLLTPESNVRLTVSHDVTVDFKGLIIAVRGLAFAGDVNQQPERITYDGSFTGISGVEVTGEYRGLSALGMGEMIRNLIREAIEEEARVLATGNSGKGWTVHADLGPDEQKPEKHVFTLEMELESPVHITELLRYESDEGGPVLPDRAASYEFRNYAEEVLTALLLDTRRFQCD